MDDEQYLQILLRVNDVLSEYRSDLAGTMSYSTLGCECIDTVSVGQARTMYQLECLSH